MTTQYGIQACTGQHIGDRREQQDRVALFSTANAPGYMMAILADGMGGMKGGALAAEEVRRSAKQTFGQFSPGSDDVEAMLKTITYDAHIIIRLAGIASEQEPHSTMVALVITPTGSAVWAHVGDSRLYRFDGPICRERTIDHSYVEQLMQEGKLARDASTQGHRLASVLVNALGMNGKEPVPTIRRYDSLKAGDAFLLCSDGLWQYFDEAELGAAITVQTARQASEMLIQKARERAADASGDNCSLAIVKLVAVKENSEPVPGQNNQANTEGAVTLAGFPVSSF